jgi:hypothetical protein
LAEVLDTEDYESEEVCPCCSKLATRRDFDACHSGCINTYYTLNCSHCGHHECDKDECSLCDDASCLHNHDDDYASCLNNYEEAGDWCGFLNRAEELVAAGKPVSGFQWTMFKHTLNHNPDVVDWLCIFMFTESLSAKEFVCFYQKKLLDIRFNARLDQRIAQAKLS